MHLTVGIFGDMELIKKLGKQGTVNDIALYNHGSSDGVFTFAGPNSPDNRIQPVLQKASRTPSCKDRLHKPKEAAGGNVIPW